MPKDYFEVEEVKEEQSEEEKQAKVIEFVYQVTRKSCEPGEFASWVQDGRVVEEVIFKSCPTPLGKKQRALPSDQMKPADRIERIVNDLFEFGVPIEVLFDVDDLLKAKNIPKVTACLMEIKNMVYTGQGRSKLSSTLDGVTKAPYRCATCGEKFPRSDQLKYHMCDNHPELIEPGLRALLMKQRK